jgi:hypothetical protein
MDHMMMMMLRNAIAQVEMEEHLLEVQDGGGRSGKRPKSRGSKTIAKKKKSQPSRSSIPRQPQIKTKISFVPTKRPPVRARRPKILNKPSINNNILGQNLGQTLIPPESVRSGDSVVDDYADYEYIYFYDNYDQDGQVEDSRQKKTKQLQEETRKKNEERKQRLENQQKRAREEKSRRDKFDQERKRKEEEIQRQEQLRLRQQEQLVKEQEKERRRMKEQERRLKEQQERQLQEKRRLELSRRLEEEQSHLKKQQLSALDNSKQNRQFAQRQQRLFRLQSLQTDTPQRAQKQFQRKEKQERRRPKALKTQTARFKNRPAPVDLEKSIQKPPTSHNNNIFISQTRPPVNPIVNRSKIPRQKTRRPRVRPTKPIQNTGFDLKQTKERDRNFQFNGVLTTSRSSQESFTTINLPRTHNFVSTLATPLATRPSTGFSQIQSRPRTRPTNLRRPNTPKRQRRPKFEGGIEPRIIPIANVKPPNAKSKFNASPVQKNRNKGRPLKSSGQRNRNKSAFTTAKGPRKSKAIGFGGRFESMFHKADNVPETSFTCSSQQFPGLYADPEADCRVFHMCHKNGRRSSFLCPSGTAFDQRFMVCNWSKKVDCANAPNLYPLNRDLYKDNDNS